MSLRNQLHDAIDEVAPPAQDLDRRVRALVLADKRGRKALRRSFHGPAWNRRFEGAMALVAGVLVVALVAGLVLAGRYWRDLNSAPAAINAGELKQLEAQPVRFPVVAPGVACPDTPVSLNPEYGMGWGDGALYATLGSVIDRTDWGSFADLLLGYSPVTEGLVLVRFKDLKSTAQVASGQYPLAPSGVIAVGPVLGKEQVAFHTVTLRAEAAFRDPAHTPTLGRSGQLPGLVLLVAMQKGTSGCIGLQFDGPGIAENFVIGPDRWESAGGVG